MGGMMWGGRAEASPMHARLHGSGIAAEADLSGPPQLRSTAAVLDDAWGACEAMIGSEEPMAGCDTCTSKATCPDPLRESSCQGQGTRRGGGGQ